MMKRDENIAGTAAWRLLQSFFDTIQFVAPPRQRRRVRAHIEKPNGKRECARRVRQGGWYHQQQSHPHVWPRHLGERPTEAAVIA